MPCDVRSWCVVTRPKKKCDCILSTSSSTWTDSKWKFLLTLAVRNASTIAFFDRRRATGRAKLTFVRPQLLFFPIDPLSFFIYSNFGVGSVPSLILFFDAPVALQSTATINQYRKKGQKINCCCYVAKGGPLFQLAGQERAGHTNYVTIYYCYYYKSEQVIAAADATSIEAATTLYYNHGQWRNASADKPR